MHSALFFICTKFAFNFFNYEVFFKGGYDNVDFARINQIENEFTEAMKSINYVGLNIEGVMNQIHMLCNVLHESFTPAEEKARRVRDLYRMHPSASSIDIVDERTIIVFPGGQEINMTASQEVEMLVEYFAVLVDLADDVMGESESD